MAGQGRDFYLDVERLLKTTEYQKAPPDVYVGSNTYTPDALYTYGQKGSGYQFQYTNNVTLTKNPYFDGVSLPAGENIFDVKTVGGNISGEVKIPYVLTGMFTPTNKLTITASSLNNFSLINVTNPAVKIPYSLSMTLGGGAAHKIAQNGSSVGSIILTDLLQDSFALQGRFDGDFMVDKNTVSLGNYTDTVTVIFQIALQ